MTPIIENAVLGTDLDGQFYNLLNVRSLDPVPENLATSDDPRLTDERPPALASVTNDHVASDAAIDQSKLSLNGQIPTAWLGTSPSTAAQGDLVEYISNKNQPNGYAGLDEFGKIPASNMPDAVGAGTVTSVGLTMPPQFTVSGSPITTSGVFHVGWRTNIPDLSWFGNKSGGPAQPQFYTTALPAALIPNLNASKITAGVVNTARLPLAMYGTPHGPGMIPDPGATGAATDYLSRNLQWRSVPTATAIPYQPNLPLPALGHASNEGSTDLTITPTMPVPVPPPDPPDPPISGCTFFYVIVDAGAADPNTGYTEFPEAGYVRLPIHKRVYVYAAHPGYNNSSRSNYNYP